MLRVYIKELPGCEHIPLLYPNLGRPEHPGRMAFLNQAFDNFTTPFVEIVDDPHNADYLLIPHNFPSVRAQKDYVQEYAHLSQNLNKKIIVFWHGDSTDPVTLPNTVVFRTSQYGANIRENEIIMPPYTPDLLAGKPFAPRMKSDIPTVGFCGWAKYKNMKNRLGTMVKNACVRVISDQWSVASSHLKGLTLRMKAVKVLEGSRLIETNFILRGSYSGSPSTIKIDPQRGRQEYIENMLTSDLPLAIKGDGNYSYRFYEALSLGRVPVLLDTDCVLPLADVLDYDSFILRVDCRDLVVLDQKIRTFWDGLSDEQYAAMQRSAREAFAEHLNAKSFLQHVVQRCL